MTQFLTIEDVNGANQEKVHQSLRFQTGNFVWRVRFNLPLNPSTVNNQTCFVTDADGTLLNTQIQYNSERHYIEIEPLDAYAQNHSYILHVTTNVASSKGKRLKENISIQFKVQ